jgi:xanthine dehydrogenase accessory factor
MPAWVIGSHMHRQFFESLHGALQNGPLVLLRILETEGATPRHAGSLMWVSAKDQDFSIGGGQMEWQAIRLARDMLQAAAPEAQIHSFSLRGEAGAVGICGGALKVLFTLWRGAHVRESARQIVQQLESGQHATLNEAPGLAAPLRLEPDVPLWIVGAGHCGRALAAVCARLHFQISVWDERADQLQQVIAPGIRQHIAEMHQPPAMAHAHRLLVVLLSRDWHQDLQALRGLARVQPFWIGMMGSSRRAMLVRKQLQAESIHLPQLQTPVGLPMASETPEEIAIAIAAQLIDVRARLRLPREPTGND